MAHFEYVFATKPALREPLLALLSQLPFTSFAETDAGWNAYLPDDCRTPELDRQLTELQEVIQFTIEINRLDDRNWNAVWEAQFEPIRVEDFCGIRAAFHAPQTDVHHELIIAPKMAFGTGHHATTWMMVRAMAGLHFDHKAVLDYGCGTGILAVLASRLGAHRVVAIDIEASACENTLEHAELNGVTLDDVRRGTLSDLPKAIYDIILANINRTVLMETLPAVRDRLNIGGHCLLSGILLRDEAMIRERATSVGLTERDRREREGWVLLSFEATN